MSKMLKQEALPKISGLDGLRLAAQRYGLGHLWGDFESKIPDLFVDDATESRVSKVIDERTHIQCVTTPAELLDTLGKGLCEAL